MSSSGILNLMSDVQVSSLADGDYFVWNDSIKKWVNSSSSAATITNTAITTNGIAGGDASLGITGQASAQGGAVAIVGGTSSTTGNAGGAVTLTGGTPGATGIGGAVTVVAGASANVAAGATAAAGGAVSATSGAGGTTATGTGGASGALTIATGAGGAASGAGTGGAGGALAVTGGVGGATTTSTGGAGGTVTVTAGAGGAASGAGTGGAGGRVILQPGAGGVTVAGTDGIAGSVMARGVQLMRKQATPTAKTVTAAITAAELVTGIITTTGATGPSIHQLPTGTLLKAQFPGIADGDSFDFHIINTGTGASDDATITVNTDVTIVGSPTVGALTDATIISGSGMFRAKNTTGVTWVVYRLA